MHRILVNYADDRYLKMQRVNAYTGLRYGGLNHYISYRRENLSADFVNNHNDLLQVPRGAGLWLWKPYIIRQTLRQAKLGDVVVYSDSGAVFLASIEPLIRVCIEESPGILACDLGVLKERHWSKRDAFVSMGCDHPDYHDSPQMMATLILFAKTPASKLFVDQWLQFSSFPQLLSDSPSISGQPELPGFREHRHDQSIFSLLYKKWRLRSYQTITGQGIEKLFRSTRTDHSTFSNLAVYFYLPGYWRRKKISQNYAPPEQNFDISMANQTANTYDPQLALLHAQKLMTDKQYSNAGIVFNTIHRWLENTTNKPKNILNRNYFLGSVYENWAICNFRQQQFTAAEKNYLRAAHYQPEKKEYAIKQSLCRNLNRQAKLSTPVITNTHRPILIMFYNGFPGKVPNCQRCPVLFETTSNRQKITDADIIIYHIPSLQKPLTIERREGQKHVASSMESEALYPLLGDSEFMSQFDLTMTYKQDADIWCAYYNDELMEQLRQPLRPKTAESPVACFISNRGRVAYNREGYLAEMMRYITIDSYGSTLTNRQLSEDKGRSTKLDICANYAFTLAFENAQSQDYVTEKFYDPLVCGSVPVYLGAQNVDDFSPADRCYINAAEFSGPQELANYLSTLYQDTAAYQQYLNWKQQAFRPQFIAKAKQQRHNSLCRLCLLLKKQTD